MKTTDINSDRSITLLGFVVFMVMILSLLAINTFADDHSEGEVQPAPENKDIYGLEVLAVYQLVDDEEAPIDFQATNVSHKCGGKTSNHFRIYSDDPIVAERKFHIVLSAMNHGHVLALQPKGCEGKRMLVGWVRASK